MAEYGKVDSDFIARLEQLLGKDAVSTSAAIRQQHGHDESYFDNIAPDAVVFAKSTDDVAKVVKLCAEHRVPVIPFGTGTSLEGHIKAVEGGVTIDVSQMNKVLEIHTEDMDVTVQAGVTRKQLNNELRHTGLFFPVDPGADASLGGMAATRASGTNAVRYGTMRENVLSLTVVTPSGEIVRTARRARKSAAGYDLTRMFVGSEGTLGVITEVTLRLHGIPEAAAAAVCAFDSVAGAVNTVITAIQMGVPLARVEFIDEPSMAAVNAYADLDYQVAPTLFFEFHGTEAGVKEQAETVKAITDEHGGSDFRWATREEDRNKLWHARHNAYYASMATAPGRRALTGDACVPISRLAECILYTRDLFEKSALPTFILGHVGDGNFHTMFLIDPDKPEELEEAKRINHQVVNKALELDGTCTGEHGVGLGKKPYLEQEFGPGVNIMRTLKTAMDPLNIMNPGKVLPAA